MVGLIFILFGILVLLGGILSGQFSRYTLYRIKVYIVLVVVLSFAVGGLLIYDWFVLQSTEILPSNTNEFNIFEW